MVSVTVHRVTTGQFLAALWRTQIIAKRKQMRWTQETLAEVSGYSVQTIKYFEQSRRKPRAQTVRNLLQATGL